MKTKHVATPPAESMADKDVDSEGRSQDEADMIRMGKAQQTRVPPAPSLFVDVEAKVSRETSASYLCLGVSLILYSVSILARPELFSLLLVPFAPADHAD